MLSLYYLRLLKRLFTLLYLRIGCSVKSIACCHFVENQFKYFFTMFSSLFSGTKFFNRILLQCTVNFFRTLKPNSQQIFRPRHRESFLTPVLSKQFICTAGRRLIAILAPSQVHTLTHYIYLYTYDATAKYTNRKWSLSQ